MRKSSQWYATNIEHKRIELFEGPNEGFGDEDQQMADAPDIAKPSAPAPAPASSSYSLESIFRQLSEISTLQASRHKEVCSLIRNIDLRIQSMLKELNSYVALKKKHATNIDHKRIELFEGPNKDFGDEDQQMADAPDIARPSVLGPASFSYSLESISRQLSEISTLQASRHKEICTLIRNIDFRSRF